MLPKHSYSFSVLQMDVGNDRAQNMLGDSFSNGTGARVDLVAGTALFHRADGNGNGVSVDVTWLLRAAKAGVLASQHNCSVYASGTGFSKRAFKLSWFCRAADTSTGSSNALVPMKKY